MELFYVFGKLRCSNSRKMRSCCEKSILPIVVVALQAFAPTASLQVASSNDACGFG
jgi:hypothetical protein